MKPCTTYSAVRPDSRRSGAGGLCRTTLALLAVGAMSSCTIYTHGSAKSGGDASCGCSTDAHHSHADHQHSNPTARSGASASASGSAHASGTASGSDGRLVFRSKPRASFVSRADAAPTFVGLHGDARVKASGSGSASTKVRERATGSAKDLPNRETARRDKPTSRERAKDLPTRERPKHGEVGIARRPPPKKRPPESKAPPKPTPAPPPKPIDPPAAPPDNVFGYEEPVRGCFEGQVYFIPDSSRALPKSYADLTSSAVLYACEWDIPTRAWQQGFPGLEDRFEWFAIRYSGAFRVEQGGTWTFRLASDDGSRLTIDDKVVIDNDGVHSPKERTGTIELRPGDHSMVLEYFQGPRVLINLQLFSTPPGGNEGVFSVR